MDNTLHQILSGLRAMSAASRIKHSRHYADFLSDRVQQAATEPNMLAFIERMARLLDVDPGEMPSQITLDTILAASRPDAAADLDWLRHHSKIVGLLAVVKREDFDAAMADIHADGQIDADGGEGSALRDGGHAITIRVQCLSPLAHGADTKAGNATLYRRMQVLSTSGGILSLPFYAGNAFRGQMRDLLADDFLHRLGLNARWDRPDIHLWFFHALYSGGALCEASGADKAIRARLGGNGSVRAERIHEFRDMFPALSLLGCALGNRILPGRMQVSDLRPVCRQWGFGDDAPDAGSLYEWVFLTRHEDYESHEEHTGMIATCECLKAGTRLEGGIDVWIHAGDLARSALAHGLHLMQQKGYIGSDSRRGLGRVAIEHDCAFDPEFYVAYLAENRERILAYMVDINAIGGGAADE